MLPVLTKDYNLCSPEKKAEIYNDLLKYIDEKYLSNFIKCTNTINILSKEQVIKKYELKDDFDEQKWNKCWKLFKNNKILSNAQNLEIEKIVSDCLLIEEALKDFNKNSPLFDIEIGLAGGSLRDLILMPEPKIKDLDVVITFNYKRKFLDHDGRHISIKYNEIFKILEQQDALKEEMSLLFEKKPKDKQQAIHEAEIIEKFAFKSIENEITKYLKIRELMPPGKLMEDIGPTEVSSNTSPINYNHPNLKGVIKIFDQKLNYEVDILITTLSIKQYVDVFDFELCKVYFPFKRFNEDTARIKNHLSKNIIKNKQYLRFYNDIHVSNGFIEDYYNQTLTFTTNDFSTEQIERSLLKHYPRIKQKYPDYNLNLQCTNGVHQKPYLEALVLTQSLPTKETSTNSKKMKI